MDKDIKGPDESHRLKPMTENYNRNLFYQIYKETAALRRKLAFEIDSRKFGVDYNEVLSWFDIKLLYVFNKYQHDEKVKGYVISALTTYKARIIKNSYLPKNELFQTLDIQECYDLSELSEEMRLNTEDERLLGLTKDYLKSVLSKDAYFVFEIDLNPPPYILQKLANSEQKKIPKPNAEVIAEYLGIDGDYAIDYIKNLRKEVKAGISSAQNYFKTYNLN